MKNRSADRTGIMIVRVWIEENPSGGFRARITHTLDSAGVERTTTVGASPDDVYAAVRTWVEGFVDSN